MMISDTNYGQIYRSDEATTLLEAVDAGLDQLIARLDKEDRDNLNSKLLALFQNLQQNITALEASSNPIAKIKGAKIVEKIQPKYELLAANLRSRCWSLGVYFLGHYASASDETLAIVRRGIAVEKSAAASLAEAAASKAATKR